MELQRARVGVIAMLILCAAVTGAGAGQDDDEAKAVRLATRTLSEHLDIDEASITLDEVMAIDWPNASLGCPEPGRSYAQVIMPGFRVTLTVQDDERTHRVHVSGTRAVVCERAPRSGPAGFPGGGLLR